MDLGFDPIATIRLACFAAVLAAMAAWEGLAPKRPLAQSKGVRWTANLGVLAVDVAVLRAVQAIGPMAAAGVAADRGWGLFNLVAWPDGVVVVAAVVALDLAIYSQHVVFHKVPALWRLHRMHHADLDFDVTTGVRFHPLEILISAGIKSGLVLVLGAPAAAVLAFEVILNGASMFNHGNARMPAGLDRVLRHVLVTPDMHRVHHSIVGAETDSNFGFNVPWWDRLFGTYRAQPEAGHEAMTIGLEMFRDPGELRLRRLLTQPFRGAAR